MLRSVDVWMSGLVWFLIVGFLSLMFFMFYP